MRKLTSSDLTLFLALFLAADPFSGRPFFWPLFLAVTLFLAVDPFSGPAERLGMGQPASASQFVRRFLAIPQNTLRVEGLRSKVMA